MLAVEAQRHTSSRAGDPIISFGRNTPHKIAVKILGKEIAEDNVREGKRKMIGSLDARNRMRGELVDQIRRSCHRRCFHGDPTERLCFNSFNSRFAAEARHKPSSLENEGKLMTLIASRLVCSEFAPAASGTHFQCYPPRSALIR